MTCTIREREARIVALELQTRLLAERLSVAERELAEARRKGALYSQTIVRLRQDKGAGSQGKTGKE